MKYLIESKKKKNEAKFEINQMLNDEIERKINKNDKNKTRVNPSNLQPES